MKVKKLNNSEQFLPKKIFLKNNCNNAHCVKGFYDKTTDENGRQYLLRRISVTPDTKPLVTMTLS